MNSAAGAAVARRPSLLVRCFFSLFFRAFLFLFCLVAAHADFLKKKLRRRLQGFAHFLREHTKIMMGREFTFSRGREVFFRKKFFANTIPGINQGFSRCRTELQCVRVCSLHSTDTSTHLHRVGCPFVESCTWHITCCTGGILAQYLET